MTLTISGQNLWLWRQQAKQQAIKAHISPEEIDWFLQQVSDLDRLALRLESFQDQSVIHLQIPFQKMTVLWAQRLDQRLPIQYLLGKVYWRNFVLTVSPSVLIPRPETELIIDLALQAIKDFDNSQIADGIWVDLGTGSGAIALGLAEVLTKAQIYAIDTSPAALTMARENARNLGYEERIKFAQGDWWQPLEYLKGKVSGMISNPPYIPQDLIPQLQPEVANHEPHLALDGGEDGLSHIRHLIATAPDYLHSGGIWLIEIMAGQATIVKDLLEKQGSYQNIQIYPDLAGIDRFAMAYRR